MRGVGEQGRVVDSQLQTGAGAGARGVAGRRRAAGRAGVSV